ncbi:MAG: cupin domain-containing protein [Labilithrix sp.]
MSNVNDSKKPGESGLDALASVAASDASEPSASLRERLLASRARPGKYGVFVDRIARLFAIPTEKAEHLLAKIESPDAWKPFLVEGTELLPVKAGEGLGDVIATFVKVQPGARFPDHVHRGRETMVVLDGGFVEPESKLAAWRGEETTREDGSEHALVGLPGVPCVAAVLIVGHADFK